MAQLRVGEFYGGVDGRWQTPKAVMTRLEHPVARVVPAHGHQRPYLNLLLAGSYREATRLRRVEYRPWTLVMHPAEFEHRDEIGTGGAKFFLVEFQGDWLDGRAPDFDAEGGDAVWAAARLWRRVEEGGLATESLLGELVGALRGRGGLRERWEPRWLARVEERVRCGFVEPPGLEELAKEAGVHPVHLSRTYRRFRGEGLGDFVRRLRVVEALRLLDVEGGTLADVAARVGFADQSHMARSLRAVTGMRAGELSAGRSRRRRRGG